MKQFSFKSLTKQDVPLLLTWFKEPHVQKWWPTPKKDEDFFDHFLKRIRSKDTFAYLVLLDNEPIGYIQYYLIDKQKSSWLPELLPNTVGTDQFIGKPGLIGKGLGSQFIKEFIETILFTENIDAVIVDPDPTNKAAIRCYEKINFTLLGEFQAPWGPAQVMILLKL